MGYRWNFFAVENFSKNVVYFLPPGERDRSQLHRFFSLKWNKNHLYFCLVRKTVRPEVKRVASGRHSLPSLTKNNTITEKKIKFNSATIVYMVQDLEKNLYLCTHLKLRITGFEPQSSWKYVLRSCMTLIIIFFVVILSAVINVALFEELFWVLVYFIFSKDLKQRVWAGAIENFESQAS